MKSGLTNEWIYFQALQKIARQYMTTEQLQRKAQKEWGVSYHEALEMSYDNIQAEAREAIRGKRKPKIPEVRTNAPANV